MREFTIRRVWIPCRNKECNGRSTRKEGSLLQLLLPPQYVVSTGEKHRRETPTRNEIQNGGRIKNDGTIVVREFVGCVTQSTNAR